jgi:hypothetical protein
VAGNQLAEDPIGAYAQGQTVLLRCDFLDPEGEPGDPDVVILRIRSATGAVTVVPQVELDHPTVGRWEYRLLLPQDGAEIVAPWVYRFEGSSVAPPSINTAAERRFELLPSAFY